jgi:hypothetical protein
VITEVGKKAQQVEPDSTAWIAIARADLAASRGRLSSRAGNPAPRACMAATALCATTLLPSCSPRVCRSIV